MCGIFGYMQVEGANKKINGLNLIRELAYASTIRGTHATGFAWVSQSKGVEIEKKGVSAWEFNYDVLPKEEKVMIGHTRYLTRGSAKHNPNNHPFYGKAKKRFAFTHNGSFYNDYELMDEYDLPDTDIETDSYVAVQLIEKFGKLSTKTLKKVAESIYGHLNFAILDETGKIYIVKGDKPLALVYIPELQLYVYASTEEILIEALALAYDTKKYIVNDVKSTKVKDKQIQWIDLYQGDILVINPDGKCDFKRFKFNNPDDYFYTKYGNTKFNRYYSGWDYNYGYDYGFYKKGTKNEIDFWLDQSRYNFEEIYYVQDVMAKNQWSDELKEYYKEFVKCCEDDYGLTEEEIDLLLGHDYSLYDIEEMLNDGSIWEVLEACSIKY